MTHVMLFLPNICVNSQVFVFSFVFENSKFTFTDDVEEEEELFS